MCTPNQSFNIFEFSELLIALMALFVSIGVSWRSQKLTEGQLELQMAMWLRESMHNFFETALEYNQYKLELDKKNEDQLEKVEEALKLRKLELTMKVRKEACLNAYEEACAKYLDNKIDRKRFKRSYATHIKDIFEDGSFDDKLNNKEYPCMHIVYAKWHTNTPAWKIFCRRVHSFLID